MIINVKVKANSGKQEIESQGKSQKDFLGPKNKKCFRGFGNNCYLIYLKSEPENNKANIELINMLSKYVKNHGFLSTSKIKDFLSFGIPYKNIKIKAGLTSSEKMIELT